MRLLLSGYYGFGNAGDEAILAGAIAALRRRFPEAELVALSADPAATSILHGIHAAQRWSFRDILREVAAADFLLQGGGGLIQDSTSARSALYYLGILILARLCGTPYILLAQGLGPLRRRLTRKLTAALFRRAAAITVRDDNSAGLLAEISVNPEALTVTADLAALVDPAPADEFTAFLPPKDAGPRIGLALRPVEGAELLLTGAREAARLLRNRYQAQIVCLALHREEDRVLALEAAEALGASAIGTDSELTPAQWMGLIGALDFVIAVRLHACIFAAAQGVSFVALSYDPKVAAFAGRAGALWAPMEADLEEALALIERAWAEREHSAAARASFARELRAAAERNFDVVEATLRARSR